MIVVSDTSAISALLKIGRAELLSGIYGKVFMPDLPDFISTRIIGDRAFFSRLRTEIDDDKAEAIVLVKELAVDELLIDETIGRGVAVREGIHVLENKTSFHVDAPLKETILRAADEL